MARRGQGKLVFLDLEDRSGRLQLLASLDVLGTELLERVGGVSLGDVVGVEGEAMRTRRGELSLQLTGYELLAPNRHPLPDTWHGLADVELRYRQRYLDLLMWPRAARGSPCGRARSPRSASSSTAAASSRSRRRCCSRCTAARWRARSSRTTTSSGATSTCGSPPSST